MQLQSEILKHFECIWNWMNIYLIDYHLVEPVYVCRCQCTSNFMSSVKYISDKMSIYDKIATCVIKNENYQVENNAGTRA